MKAIDIANLFIVRHGEDEYLTNLKLNKLVYYAQVESLRSTGKVLFDEPVEAWEYGPVERSVYNVFRRYGKKQRVTNPAGTVNGEAVDGMVSKIVDEVAKYYGPLSAFDLVRFSHRPGSAWEKAFSPDADNEITPDMILSSTDGKERPNIERSLAWGIATAEREYPNALRMLEDS
ncbi:DUF4065 domain-containing protein [Bifidobacterium sp. ESL0728]|uniref:Panacea domain-containing protein n=1 Tax=Bifidobacterium sp. ESL0728 TaxID=2983220 RepID=UPI0023F639E1|nr:type II toxin-antitoxin system antitoxin SocA domain-containing protein [Bifidobacterium sp. ESL0728]WEV58528.1 DUF4065 domain-containing protein [Bifidobacterium sp. ESL0728]